MCVPSVVMEQEDSVCSSPVLPYLTVTDPALYVLNDVPTTVMEDVPSVSKEPSLLETLDIDGAVWCRWEGR